MPLRSDPSRKVQYGRNFSICDSPAFGGVGNGHPEDKYGWAMAGGAKFNLAGGDMIGFNVCYAEGAAGFCTNNNFFHALQLQHQRGPRLDRRRHLHHRPPDRARPGCGVLLPGTSTSGTRNGVPRCSAATLTSTTAALPPTASCRTLPGALANCGVPGSALPPSGTSAQGNSCSPDMSFWEAGTRTQWNPVPQLDIGLEVLYSTAQYRLQRRRPRARQPLAAPVLALDDQDVCPRCSAGSVTSIHDRLSDPGTLQAPGGQPPGVLLCLKAALI